MAKEINFPGYDHFIIGAGEELPGEIPANIKLTDTGQMVKVDLELMCLTGDAGDLTIRLRQKSQSLIPATAQIFCYVMIQALNGKRKVSSVTRWANEFSLFTRTVRKRVTQPIAMITFEMFNWYTSKKNASQQKLLRSALKFWVEQSVPGIAEDLKDYLAASKAPKPKSTIEIQNSVERERPFTIEQTRRILSDIEDLYASGTFSPQDYLMWRLIVSEAMRPSQMRLLRVGDINLRRGVEGKLVQVLLKVPIVKQKTTPAREYMMEHRLSEPVGRAMVEHLAYLETLLGRRPSAPQPIFSVNQAGKGRYYVENKSIGITAHIERTRRLITAHNGDLMDVDLFTRRFKHTKLTHLAMLGAPLEVLARAGFQTSTISLRHYVNLSEEAFVEYENLLSHQYDEILSGFKGRVLDREQATHTDPDHMILDPDMNLEVGSCASNPCNVLAPFGCYVCPRFEAFSDGPHELVLEALLHKRERAVRMELPAESVGRDNHIISAVRDVIATIAGRSSDGRQN